VQLNYQYCVICITYLVCLARLSSHWLHYAYKIINVLAGVQAREASKKFGTPIYFCNR